MIKERTRKRYESGLCPICGRARENENYSMCLSCRQKKAKYSREKSKQWKDNEMCQKCGKPLDRVGYFCSKCAKKHAEYTKETSDMYKSVGLCATCGKNKVLGNEVNCLECRARNADLKIRQYNKDRSKILKRNSDYRKNRKITLESNGLCIVCGKKPQEDGVKTCAVCRAKNNRKARERYVHGNPFWMQDKIRNGTCIWCDKPSDKGQVLCLSCAEKARKNGKKGASVSHWRADNKMAFMGGTEK